MNKKLAYLLQIMSFNIVCSTECNLHYESYENYKQNINNLQKNNSSLIIHDSQNNDSCNDTRQYTLFSNSINLIDANKNNSTLSLQSNRIEFIYCNYNGNKKDYMLPIPKQLLENSKINSYEISNVQESDQSSLLCDIWNMCCRIICCAKSKHHTTQNNNKNINSSQKKLLNHSLNNFQDKKNKHKLSETLQSSIVKNLKINIPQDSKRKFSLVENNIDLSDEFVKHLLVNNKNIKHNLPNNKSNNNLIQDSNLANNNSNNNTLINKNNLIQDNNLVDNSLNENKSNNNNINKNNNNEKNKKRLLKYKDIEDDEDDNLSYKRVYKMIEIQ